MGDHASHDWVRRAYDCSEVMMATVAGPEHTFVAVNEAYLRFHGYPDVLGRRPQDLWPELEGQQLVRFLDRVRSDARPASFEEWCFQFVRDDSLEDVWLDFALVPEVEDGEVLCTHFYLREVGDRVRARRAAEQDLSAAREQYADALDQISRLQDQLLPDALPALPRVDVAASYLLAGEHQSAGGDWFDCLVRPDGSVALVVGDVVGHGVAASAVMGQLRAVLASSLLRDDPLEQCLDSLDRYAAAHGGGAVGSTVCVLELSPGTGRVRAVSAGHPPPVVVPPEGEGRFVGLTPTAPLATVPGPRRFEPDELELQPDEVVVLVSDGLVERPGRTPGESTVEILQVLTDLCQGRGPDRDHDRVVEAATLDALELLLRETGHQDDVTVLAAQRVRGPSPLHVRLHADAEGGRTARWALVGWLDTLEIGVLDRVTVQHAVGELIDNVVTHAYRFGRVGELSLDVLLDDTGVVVCRVADDGAWLECATPDRSPVRGLAMVQSLVEDLEVTPGGERGGTVVEIRQRLRRPARLLTQATSRPLGPARPVVGQEVGIRESEEGLRVHGEVDADGATTLRGLLAGATGGGSRRAVVDLAGVTHLGSAGVQVLHELAGEGSPVTLRAPYGSVAQHVLSLAGLPFEG